MVLHCLQLLPHTPHRDAECHKYMNMNPGQKEVGRSRPVFVVVVFCLCRRREPPIRLLCGHPSSVYLFVLACVFFVLSEQLNWSSMPAVLCCCWYCAWGCCPPVDASKAILVDRRIAQPVPE